jgi:hypothetical protein
LWQTVTEEEECSPGPFKSATVCTYKVHYTKIPILCIQSKSFHFCLESIFDEKIVADCDWLISNSQMVSWNLRLFYSSIGKILNTNLSIHCLYIYLHILFKHISFNVRLLFFLHCQQLRHQTSWKLKQNCIFEWEHLLIFLILRRGEKLKHCNFEKIFGMIFADILLY